MMIVRASSLSRAELAMLGNNVLPLVCPNRRQSAPAAVPVMVRHVPDDGRAVPIRVRGPLDGPGPGGRAA